MNPKDKYSLQRSFNSAGKWQTPQKEGQYHINHVRFLISLNLCCRSPVEDFEAKQTVI